MPVATQLLIYIIVTIILSVLFWKKRGSKSIPEILGLIGLGVFSLNSVLSNQVYFYVGIVILLVSILFALVQAVSTKKNK